MATTLVGDAQSEERPPPSLGRILSPRSPGTRRNRPALVLGAVLVIVCGAASAALYASAGHRDSVLAVRREIAPGARVTDGDLAVVDVAAGSTLRLIPVSDRPRVVGRVARVGLIPGAPLTYAQFAQGDAVPAGQSVVAVLLRFGQAPNLVPGDRVRVVAPASSLDAPAQVFAVDHQTQGSDDVRVSVQTDDANATRIAEAVTSQGQISVVRRSSGP